jgi:hypothetical protein
MITAQVEKWSDALPEMIEIFPDHYKALALDQEYVPLSPRYGLYKSMEDNGTLLVVTARELGWMAGYFVGFVMPSMHYSTCLECRTDIFWVVPRYRVGGRNVGKILFRGVENELRRRCVQRWHVGTKLHQDASALFVRLGFKPVEVYYSKWLGE